MRKQSTIYYRRGEVFYDAECPMCAGGVARWGGLFERRGFHWLPLQTPGAPDRTGFNEIALREEMKLRLRNGRIVGGAAAWAFLFRSIWWLWSVGFLIELPGFDALSVAIYRWIARNRYCFGSVCRAPRR